MGLMDPAQDDQARQDQVRALVAIIIDAEPEGGPHECLAQRLHAAVRGIEQVLKGLLGELGTRALIARASHLSRRTRVPSTSATAPETPSVMELTHWRVSVSQQGGALARHEAEELLAQGITLLCDFIGSDSVFRVFSRSYPEFHGQRIGRDPSQSS